MNRITPWTTAILAAAIALSAPPARASDDTRHAHGRHMHGPLHGNGKEAPMHDGAKGMAMHGAFVETKEIDGFTVTFHVMKAMEGMAHGGSHHLMVKVEKDGAVLRGIAVNSKVIHPGGASESKMMSRTGDWFTAAYDLGHPGRHQVMVLFKTPDGAKHFGGVFFRPDGR